MKKSDGGFSAIEALIILVIVGVIGFAGWHFYNSRKDKKVETKTSTTSPARAVVAKTWKEGGIAVASTYADADVLQIATGKYRMYYAVQPEVSGNHFEVYSSTSTDGKTWTQEPGTRKTMATFPDVVKTKEGKYRMYYQSAGTLKSAISDDGLTFTDEPGTRIDTVNDAGLVLDNVAAPSVLLSDGSYTMIYRGTINTRYAAGTPNATTQLLFWATSPDGLTFTKKGIAVDSRNATLQGQLDGPDLQKWDDSKLHIFATTYKGVYEFVFTNGVADAGTLAYALTPAASSANAPADAAPPGDPTLQKIGDVWYMYYGGPRTKNGINYATYQ